MAGGGGGARRDAGEHTRAIVFGVIVVVSLLATGLLTAHRQGMAHSSKDGDACPVTASGGLVGFDARTGEVAWTNIVPPNSQMTVHDGEVHLLAYKNHTRLLDRTIDPDTGAVTHCTAAVGSMDGVDEPLDPPATVGDLTVARWGDGVRATDPAGTGAWSRRHTQVEAVLDDAAVVSTQIDGAGTIALLDLHTGDVIWSGGNALAAAVRPDQPIITTDLVHRRQITARDPEDGSVRWTASIPALDTPNGRAYGYSTGGLLVFPTGEGASVTAVDAETGQIRWSADGGSPGQNRRATAPGHVGEAVVSPDGRTVIVSVTAYDPELD